MKYYESINYKQIFKRQKIDKEKIKEGIKSIKMNFYYLK